MHKFHPAIITFVSELYVSMAVIYSEYLLTLLQTTIDSIKLLFSFIQYNKFTMDAC